MKITFGAAGLAQFDRAIKEAAGGEALKSLNRAQAEALRQMAEQNFRSETNRPAPWAPLAASTVAGFSKARKSADARRLKQAAKKGKRAAGARPLIDTATLARSLSTAHVREDGAMLVSTQDYAGYHQFGSVKRPGRPPARPFVPVTGAWGGELAPTPAAEKRMAGAAESALRAAARKAGFGTS